MALSFKARRRWSLFVLLVGMPAYIGFAWWLLSLFEARPNVLVELLIYIVLGVIWILPLKSVFLGVGKADPDAKPEE